MTRYNKTIEIVTFDELSDKAKEKARDWYRKISNEDDADFVSMCFQQRLEDLGYPTDQVEWSLGFSQSDYVAFFGRCNQDKLLERLGLLSDPRFTGYDAPTITIDRGGRHYMAVYVDDVENEDLQEEILKAVKEDVRTTASALMHEGHDTLLDLGSDETVDRAILDNEYTFRTDGTREDL